MHTWAVSRDLTPHFSFLLAPSSSGLPFTNSPFIQPPLAPLGSWAHVIGALMLRSKSTPWLETELSLMRRRGTTPTKEKETHQETHQVEFHFLRQISKPAREKSKSSTDLTRETTAYMFAHLRC